jgi:hypothetical protein
LRPLNVVYFLVLRKHFSDEKRSNQIFFSTFIALLLPVVYKCLKFLSFFNYIVHGRPLLFADRLNLLYSSPSVTIKLNEVLMLNFYIPILLKNEY